MSAKEQGQPDKNNFAAFGAILGILLAGYWMCNRSSNATTAQINYQAIAEQAARAQAGNPGTFKIIGGSDPHVVGSNTCVVEEYTYRDQNGNPVVAKQNFCIDSLGHVRDIIDL